MAVIHHEALGVEKDVPEQTVEIWTEPPPGPGWVEGPAPWPRDDYGVPHKPDDDDQPAKAKSAKAEPKE
jgi:hypothetical protein